MISRIFRKLMPAATSANSNEHFYQLKAKDQKRLIEDAVRKSNTEQKELLDEYTAQGHPRTT